MLLDEYFILFITDSWKLGKINNMSSIRTRDGFENI